MTQTINWYALTSIQRDQLIAEKFFGWQPIPCDGELTIYDDGDAWCPGCQERDHISTIEHGIIAPPTYSTAMSSAWLIVEQLRKKGIDIHIASSPFSYDALALDRQRGEMLVETSGQSATEIICIVALRACGYEVVEAPKP